MPMPRKVGRRQCCAHTKPKWVPILQKQWQTEAIGWSASQTAEATSERKRPRRSGASAGLDLFFRMLK